MSAADKAFFGVLGFSIGLNVAVLVAAIIGHRRLK